MWVNRTRVADRSIELHKVLADWGEAGSSGDGAGGRAQIGDATWLNTFYNTQANTEFWATPGGDFVSQPSGSQLIGSSGAAYTWSSTNTMVSDVQSWLDDPNSNFGWLLQGDESTRSSKRFDSRDSSNPPTLTIDYTEASMPPDISISDAGIVEGNTGTTSAQFDVELSAASTQTVTVSFATADDTATAGDDYVAANGTLTFAAGETLKTVSVPVNGDQLVELDETFVVNLSAAQNAIITDGQGVGTITNDDSANITINDVTLAEGDSGTTNFDFTVTLSAAVDTPLTVDFTTADSTATTSDSDYAANAGTLNFAGTAGETQTITVLVTGDTTFEPNEDFLLNLANIVAGGRAVTLSDNQGTGTITNDDTSVLPSLSISDITVVEGNAGALAAQFDVALSDVSGSAVTVGYSTADDTATAGDDYVAANGTLTFAAGETLKTISVPINGDQLVELDETFVVDLSAAQNAIITDGQGVGTITNDD